MPIARILLSSMLRQGLVIFILLFLIVSGSSIVDRSETLEDEAIAESQALDQNEEENVEDDRNDEHRDDYDSDKHSEEGQSYLASLGRGRSGEDVGYHNRAEENEKEW